MTFPLVLAPFLEVNRPSRKNVVAEAGIFLLLALSVLLYLAMGRSLLPWPAFAWLVFSNALVGFIIEYRTHAFYTYHDTLFSWFKIKDFSLTFAVAYGGLFSACHLVSLHLAGAWGVPGWIQWLFPNPLLTILVVGTVDSVYYRVIRYYDFNPAFFEYATHMLRVIPTPILGKRIPPCGLPVGVVVSGYGVLFGIVVKQVNEWILLLAGGWR
jgi:hypothetical protein